jgi:hypothetical protein
MRTFPGWSARGSSQTLSEVQVTTAEVAVPVSSASGKPEVLEAPVAWFQLLLGATPATSELPIVLPNPTKLMLMTLMDELEITLSVALAACVKDPLAAVTVRVKLPVGVAATVVTMSVELPEPLMLVGEKEAEAPEGSPVTARPTVPEKPFSAATLTV